MCCMYGHIHRATITYICIHMQHYTGRVDVLDVCSFIASHLASLTSPPAGPPGYATPAAAAAAVAAKQREEAFSQVHRPLATSVCDLQLLVYASFSY